MQKHVRRLLPTLLIILVIAGAMLVGEPADARRRTNAPAKRETRAKQSKGAKARRPETPRTARDVRREKKRTEGEIARTQQDIAANAKDTRRQLNRLGRLDSEIEVSAAKVSGLQGDVERIRARVKGLSDTVSMTEAKVGRLREAYARNLQSMRRQRQGVSNLTFIFSAGNFTGMMSRARYLKELSAAQSSRARALKAELDTLRERKARLDSLEATLKVTLAAHRAENARLQDRRKSASELVDSLRRQGSSLRSVLKEKQAQARRLEAELDRIIAEEARKAAEEEAKRKAAEEERRRKAEAEAAETSRKEATGTTQSGGQNAQKGDSRPAKPAKEPTPPSKGKAPEKSINPGGATALGGSFAANKGRLPAPVDKAYTISAGFGQSAHPELSRINVRNNGIDLRTTAGASARAVFRGTVSSIFRLDGYNNIVILRHGAYLTVYAGIGELKVRKGEEVAAGQLLGTLAPDPDDDNRPTLHFEIRQEKTKLNPTEWLRKN